MAYYQAPATLTGNRTYTGPGDADDTLVGVAATQTRTNKTLTSPAIGATPRFGHTVTPGAAAGSSVADAAALADFEHLAGKHSPNPAGVNRAAGANRAPAAGVNRTAAGADRTSTW